MQVYTLSTIKCAYSLSLTHDAHCCVCYLREYRNSYV